MCKKVVGLCAAFIAILAVSVSLGQSRDIEASALNTAADLDLSGEIVYAINFGNNGKPKLGGVVFAQGQDHANLSRDISAEGVITRWDGVYPNTGNPELDMLLGGIIWKNSGVGGRTTSVTIADALTVGTSYRLQLVFYTDHARPMDIIVEGETIIERYDPFPFQGYVTGKGGSVVNCVFTAGDSTLNVAVKSNPDLDASLLSGLILSNAWPPRPDFNDDYVVDIHDLVILIEHWGKNEPSLDLAPPPSGDGIVDAQDLAVLMSYWGQELYDPSLLTHWPLDETEGNTAYDSAGNSDAIVVGVPMWQPAGGKLDGALLLGGSGDCVMTRFVCNPDDGPFSVFAWVSGGAPGQVIISQRAGLNWLTAALATGALATELKQSAHAGKALTSSVVITDGAWHRVGLVWDGSHRSLYVDDIEVARDTQPGVAASISGLNIGAGAFLAPGTFWSGLIDDVRIYSRVVKP